MKTSLLAIPLVAGIALSCAEEPADEPADDDSGDVAQETGPIVPVVGQPGTEVLDCAGA